MCSNADLLCCTTRHNACIVLRSSGCVLSRLSAGIHSLAHDPARTETSSKFCFARPPPLGAWPRPSHLSATKRWTKPATSPAARPWKMARKGDRASQIGDSTSRSNAAAGENTPLLGEQHPSAHLAVPGSREVNGPRRVVDNEEGDEIDPNDFDILLSKSVPTSGGFLEPESYENSMLRGDRRYSSSGRRPSAASLGRTERRRVSRSSSASAAAEDLESPFNEDEAASSPAHEASEDAPLLGHATSRGSLRTEPPTPYLNNISVSRFWVIFSGLLATIFIACFDGTIMASSHPVITSYFESSNSASWLSTAFLLTSTAFQPLLGRISDSLGRKPPYLVTMVIFALSTLWCALANSMTSFILARAACGIGAGGMMTLGSIIISDMVPIEYVFLRPRGGLSFSYHFSVK